MAEGQKDVDGAAGKSPGKGKAEAGTPASATAGRVRKPSRAEGPGGA